MSWGFAPIISSITHTDTSAEPLTSLPSGDAAAAIRVWGYSFANTTGTAMTVTLQSADGNATTYVILEIPPNDTRISEIPWIADKGLQIVGEASLETAIFHSHAGS